jgi:hypothetical protein
MLTFRDQGKEQLGYTTDNCILASRHTFYSHVKLVVISATVVYKL